ncbi:AAA family ATPase, partial [Sulfurimonas sp. SAG-AH-194-C21]
YIAREIYKKLQKKESTLKNYILIIDEINRGNISKIFGELITLIEPSKRIGEDEEIMLKLPNSSESFGVPSNLYIIGTMNTADRSIAQIDTALRRRFEFVEMMPQSDLLVFNNDENKPLIINAEKDEKFEPAINVQEILNAINERIEYIYDREHTIGHSYFMPLIKTPTKEKLDEIFRVNIIPLLAEYFYGDWADIKFVLNNNFIKEKPLSKYINNEEKKNLNKIYEVSKDFVAGDYLKIYDMTSREQEEPKQK